MQNLGEFSAKKKSPRLSQNIVYHNLLQLKEEKKISPDFQDLKHWIHVHAHTQLIWLCNVNCLPLQESCLYQEPLVPECPGMTTSKQKFIVIQCTCM